MQIILLIFLSAVISVPVVLGTQSFLGAARSGKKNLIFFLLAFVTCLLFSVLADCVIQAGAPAFYYHTHKPGRATLRIFGVSCLCGGIFFALILMLAERKHQKKSVLRWIVRSFLLSFCAAVLLEVGFFNFRHFELVGSNTGPMEFTSEQVLPHGFYFNRADRKFHPFYYTAVRDFEIYPGYKKVRNISFEFDDGNPVTRVEPGFNDRTHAGYELLPVHEFIRGVPRSYSIPLHTVGLTYSLLLRLPDAKEHDGNAYGVSLPRITLNRVVPLELDPVRFLICFLVLFCFFSLCPGSPLWRVPLDFRCFGQLSAVLGLFVLICGVFAWTAFSSYTGSELPIREQKAALNENYQQYDKLVEALMVPRYALSDIPHRYLEQLDDPYDMRQRERKQFDYLWDTAYYNGSYYVYFGVVPAVTVLMPYKLLTGSDLDLDYPILGFCVLTAAGVCGIYVLLVRRFFRNISFGLFWTGLLMLLTSLNLTWCLRRTLVYELAITSGVCFAVWGIFFMLSGGGQGKMQPVWFFLSGTCSALAVGCRPTMLFVSLVVFTAAAHNLKEGIRRDKVRSLLSVVLFAVPYLLAGLALMKYNFERFGDPFEFGITYQLTTENRAAGLPLLGFSGRLLSVLSSLFTFPTLDLNFPFIHVRKPDLPYNGVILNTDTVLGIFSYPVLWFLFVLPFLRKKLRVHGPVLPAFCTSCLTAAAAICFTASDFAITNRYLTDILFLAVLPAVFGMLCVYERFEAAQLQKGAQAMLLFAAFIGVCLCLTLSLTGEGDWFSRINPLYYARLKYALSPWL